MDPNLAGLKSLVVLYEKNREYNPATCLPVIACGSANPQVDRNTITLLIVLYMHLQYLGKRCVDPVSLPKQQPRHLRIIPLDRKDNRHYIQSSGHA